MNVGRLDDLRGRLLRHGGDYYVLRRAHADGFDLAPLARLVLTVLGIVAAAVGVGLELRARPN